MQNNVIIVPILFMLMLSPIGCFDMEFYRTCPGSITTNNFCIGEIRPLVIIILTGDDYLQAFAISGGQFCFIKVLKPPNEL